MYIYYVTPRHGGGDPQGGAGRAESCRRKRKRKRRRRRRRRRLSKIRSRLVDFHRFRRRPIFTSIMNHHDAGCPAADAGHGLAIGRRRQVQLSSRLLRPCFLAVLSSPSLSLDKEMLLLSRQGVTMCAPSRLSHWMHAITENGGTASRWSPPAWTQYL